MTIFIQYYLPQILLIILIIIFSYIIIRKGKWKIADFLQDRSICMTAGLLLLIDGIIKFISYLSNLLPHNFGMAAISYSISNLISIVFVLGLIISGISLIKFYQGINIPEIDSAVEKSTAAKNAIGIVLLYMVVFTATSIMNTIIQYIILSQSVIETSFVSITAYLAIILCLFLFAKKMGWNFHIFIRDRQVRIVSGSILIINGIIRLAFDFSRFFSSIGSSIDSSFYVFKIMIVVQIIAGIYLTRMYQDKPVIDQNNELEKM